MVMIGIDPHKRSHTAVAVDEREMVIGERLVHARAGQVAKLVARADALGDGQRIWAVESAGGLGSLLSQQLLAAGEHVVDIPAMLASRVRVLSSGRSDEAVECRGDEAVLHVDVEERSSGRHNVEVDHATGIARRPGQISAVLGRHAGVGVHRST